MRKKSSHIRLLFSISAQIVDNLLTFTCEKEWMSLKHLQYFLGKKKKKVYFIAFLLFTIFRNSEHCRETWSTSVPAQSMGMGGEGFYRYVNHLEVLCTYKGKTKKVYSRKWAIQMGWWQWTRRRLKYSTTVLLHS